MGYVKLFQQMLTMQYQLQRFFAVFSLWYLLEDMHNTDQNAVVLLYGPYVSWWYEKCLRTFGPKTLMENDCLEDINADGRITLN